MRNVVTLKIGSGNGITDVYEGWEAVKITKSLEQLSGSFSLSLTQKFNSNNLISAFDIRRGDECILSIDNKTIITGFIDDLTVSYSSDSHSIAVSGRDKTSDIIDGSLIGDSDLSAPYTAKQLVEHVLSSKSITSISVSDLTGQTNLYDNDFDAGAGRNAWNELDKYLQKKSIFATVDSEGDILLFRGSFGKTNNALYNLIDDNDVNNIISGTMFDDMKNRFNKISILSQESSLSTDGIFYEQGGIEYSATDSTIRETRQIELVANTNLTSQECQTLADFNKNIRQARGTYYQYMIYGFVQSNGDLWLPNYEVYVKDQFFGISDYFLIKSVTFEQSLERGSITTLDLVDKYAFSTREPIAITQENNNVLFQT